MSTSEQYDGPHVAPATHTEIVLLGAMLSDEDARELALSSVVASDFLLDSHRRIFAVIADMVRTGAGIDDITVMQELKARRELDSVGGFEYLLSLSQGVPRRPKITTHIKTLKETATRRNLLTLGNNLVIQATEGEEDTSLLIERAHHGLLHLSSANLAAPLAPVGDFIESAYANPSVIFEREKGLPTGMGWLDKKTNGLVRKNLIVVAARPSIGKTAWVTSLVNNMTISGVSGSIIPGALFTFEQDKRQLSQRIICNRARVSLSSLLAGEVRDTMQREYVFEAIARIKESPLYWDDTPGLTVSQIRAKVKRLKRELGKEELGYVMIDQLSFVDLSEYRDRKTQKQDWIGAATRDLKKMAAEEDVPVVLLCQISRAGTKNKDNRPTLADLAESGQIEQNADVVLLLHRGEFYDRTDPDLRGKGEFILAKQRQGPIGTHQVLYSGPMCRWTDPWTPAQPDDDDEYFLPTGSDGQ